MDFSLNAVEVLKHAKCDISCQTLVHDLKVFGFSTLIDMTSQSYPSPEENESLRFDI